MNPYDFVSIDWNRPPERRKPIWHNRLTGVDGQHLYSGSIELDIYAETPLFIADPRAAPSDPRKATQSIKNKPGQYIIPGSSLKGMVRTVVETLGNGCLTLFDGRYDGKYRNDKVNYYHAVPLTFQKCKDSTNLCIACRIFGMLRVDKEREGSNGEKEDAKAVFLGKVNIGDAVVVGESKVHAPIYTFALMNPKPYHDVFYLDETRKHIAGRKFYFHHEKLLQSETLGKYNRYIQPLDSDTKFHTRIDFTNLEEDEFGALLLALTLEENMRHKIGYGKPLGLGSINMIPTSLTLVDYVARYTQQSTNRGKKTWTDNEMWQQVIYGQVERFSVSYLVQIAMDDLRRIWAWPPDDSVDYYYPSKRDWFDTEDSQGKRIADTRNVPRQR